MRWKSPTLPITATLLMTLAAAACGNPTEPAAPPEKPAEEDEFQDPVGPEAPPPVTIRYENETAELEAWTFCYANGCADGMPPKHPLDVGSPDEIIVEFPLEDWTFEATFTEAGADCARDLPATAEPLGGGRHVLRPAGHPGTYDVTLFGRGDGDLFVSFRWTTAAEGPLPSPKARLAVLADHDGELDSYGVELMLWNLAEQPNDASAVITVTAANGRKLTFDAKPSRMKCLSEGTVYWDGPDSEGLAAAELGACPCSYEVEVTLDGERHRARAVWPRDEIKGNEPSARLDFYPALPPMG